MVRAVLDDLPREPVVYFGDTARYPYGSRALGEIRQFAVQIARHLAGQDVKMIVVACNAATAAGLDDVVEAVPVPVVGVIEPAVRAAVRGTRDGRVGLIGTVATVNSGAYQRVMASVGQRVELFPRACPLFVEFVERGDTTSPELMSAAGEYLAPLLDADVDTLILGCTHYPLLRALIHHIMGPGVLLLSSADETANDVYEMLASKGLLADVPGSVPPTHRFETSGDPERFADLGRRFLGPEFRGAVGVSLQPGVCP